MAKSTFTPQKLRGLLGFFLVLVTLGGGALFYYGVETVKAYAISVNERLVDANDSENNIKQLQLLKSQLAQSEILISKADQMFATPQNYQAQALIDVQNYANQTGISLTTRTFETPEGTNLHLIVLGLNNPTNYSQLLQFLTLVEANIPKMQVHSISLKHVAGGDSNTVEVSEIKINIAVR